MGEGKAGAEGEAVSDLRRDELRSICQVMLREMIPSQLRLPSYRPISYEPCHFHRLWLSAGNIHMRSPTRGEEWGEATARLNLTTRLSELLQHEEPLHQLSYKLRPPDSQLLHYYTFLNVIQLLPSTGMAFSTLGSAIDDSFSPNFLPFIEDDSASSVYNGPRSGHWTVSSGFDGSAIDDRCPTFWGSTFGLNAVGERSQVGAYVNPIDGSLLKKLGRATVEEQRRAFAAESEVVGEGEGAIGIQQDRETEVARQDNARLWQEKKPKGFYMPRANDGRGVKVTTKSDRDEVVGAPPAKPDIEKYVRYIPIAMYYNC